MCRHCILISVFPVTLRSVMLRCVTRLSLEGKMGFICLCHSERRRMRVVMLSGWVLAGALQEEKDEKTFMCLAEETFQLCLVEIWANYMRFHWQHTSCVCFWSAELNMALWVKPHTVQSHLCSNAWIINALYATALFRNYVRPEVEVYYWSLCPAATWCWCTGLTLAEWCTVWSSPSSSR